MAGMFYSLEEIAELLGGDEGKAEDLVKEHKLREFRDGGTRVVYKASEVDKILASGPATIGPDEIVDMSAQEPAAPEPAEEESFDLVDEIDDTPILDMSDEDDEPVFELAGDDDDEPGLDFVDDSDEPALELSDDSEPELIEEDESPASLNVDLPSGDMSTLGLAPEETASDDFGVSLEDESLAPLEQSDGSMPEMMSDDSELDLGNMSDLGLDDESGDPSDDSINALLGSGTGIAKGLDDVPSPVDQLGGSSAADIISDLTGADTRGATTGINVLGEGDDDFELSTDSKAETSDVDVDDDLGDLDDDINLDTVGSGSGLLDLSLQADDTSLGAVLDDILPAAAEDEAPMPIGDDMDDLGGDDADAAIRPAAVSVGAAAPAGAAVPVGAAVAYEAPPDTSSNLMGVLLLLPMFGLIYGIIVVVNGFKGVTPGIFESIKDMAWMIFAGLAGACLLFGIIFSVMGGGSGEGKPKAAKQKTVKEKKKKEPKPKPEKKKKEPKPKPEKKKKTKK